MKKVIDYLRPNGATSVEITEEVEALVGTDFVIMQVDFGGTVVGFEVNGNNWDRTLEDAKKVVSGLT